MYTPANLGIAFSLTMLAGLTTAIGGAVAFITKKHDLKVLSLGLGFSAGVMIFISLVDIIPTANEMLKANFPNMFQWLVFFGFVTGLLILPYSLASSLTAPFAGSYSGKHGSKILTRVGPSIYIIADLGNQTADIDGIGRGELEALLFHLLGQCFV